MDKKTEMTRLRAVRAKAVARGTTAANVQRSGKAVRVGREVARLEHQDFRNKQR